MHAVLSVLVSMLMAASSSAADRGMQAYTEHQYDKAATEFKHALDEMQGESEQDLLIKQKLYLAIAGSYYHQQKYDEAAKYFEQLLQVQTKLFGATDLQCGWAMYALADVYRKLGRQEESNRMHDDAIWIFRDFNRARLVAACKSPEVAAKLGKGIFGMQSRPEKFRSPAPGMFAGFANAPPPDCSIARSITYFADAPGRVWLDCDVPCDVILIAVHGLSLDHGVYAQLGDVLAKRGVCTVAFDVRGFGTYRSALGADMIDFEESIDDLYHVVASIRRDHPDRKLFILGESMGGAIALQLAARHPELCDGVISSVPAGKRYKQLKQSIKTAISYIADPHHPIDIGKDVIKQATQNSPELRREWETDPNTRGKISPEELIRFQTMIDRNIQFAKQVDKLPVLVFQGVDDRLVKLKATYEIFQAIASPDKNMVAVGNAEHLIFEEGQFTPSNVEMVLGWMTAHGAHVVR